MNIGGLLTRSARLYPDRPAVSWGREHYRYNLFNSRVNRLANALTGRGLSKGDRVALLMHNCPQMLEAMFAAFKAGMVAVPINFRLHLKEYSYIIQQSGARAVILSQEFNEENLNSKEPALDVELLVTTGGAVGPLKDYEGFLAAGRENFEDVEVEPDDPAWLFYTSGTTGRPKGATLTHRNLLAMTLCYYADFGPLGPRDAILHAAPLSHGSGLYSIPNIARGAHNVIPAGKSFVPDQILGEIEAGRITNMFAAPTMVKLMVEAFKNSAFNISRLRNLIYGGGPMHVEDLVSARKVLGDCLTQLYGMGETPMTITYLPREDHELGGSELQLKRLASAGFSRTGVEVRVVDSGDNRLEPYRKGEVVVRSDVVMKGYWQNPGATAEAMRGGWLHTGDVGYLDEAGYLFLLDRAKDMIISGGENIYPREVEEVLARHPAVREVAVIGVPDAKWGESVVAIVSLSEDHTADEDQLIGFCRENLASYKKPKKVYFTTELPKNNYGKILKRELKDKFGVIF